MPAYYWIQLYKDPGELTTREIVNKTVEGLVEAGCVYQFARITNIEDDSLPQMDQVPITKDTDFGINEAIDYACKDIESWQTTEKDKKWLPGIKLVFEFNFQFDEEVKAKFDEQKAKKVRQVTLDFWIRKDELFNERIMIDLDTWEEYVLIYGQEKTHNHNKHQILKIVESICNQINPHFGWLDGEMNSFDDSYELIGEGKWPVGNEFIVVGSQLIDKISEYNLEQTPNCISKLNDGGLILKGSP
ncbi:MAG: hypothetical protein R3D55_04120 [Chloroflexota bacterium]